MASFGFDRSSSAVQRVYTVQFARHVLKDLLAGSFGRGLQNSVKKEAVGRSGYELLFGEAEDFVQRLLALLAQVFHLGGNKHDLRFDACHGRSLVNEVEVGADATVVLLLHLLNQEVATVKANEEESSAREEKRT